MSKKKCNFVAQICKAKLNSSIYGLKKIDESKNIAIFAAETKSMEPMQDKKEQDLQRRIIELEAALKHEQMKNLALNTMIDIAEEQGIQIRKKSGAKQ